MSHHWKSIFLVLLALVLAALACGKGTPSPTPPPPTSPPMPTNTPKPASTDTPSPTATPEPPPPTETPQARPEPGWYMYTNGNYVREIALLDGVVWAATGGGVVAWDVASGQPLQKYTTLDGLPTNDLVAIAACPIPEPRVVVGSEYGVSIYDPQRGSWETWNSQNSGMQYDDVESLDCEPSAKMLLVGYMSGLNIFDAEGDAWLFYDEEDGLASGWVNQAAFTPSGDLWVASSFGVSAIHPDGTITPYLEDDTEGVQPGEIPDENVEAIAGDAQGNIWLAAFDGLIKFRDGAWTLYNSDNVDKFPFLDAFDGLAVAEDGTIWVGNAFGDICRFDPAKETCVEMYEDEKGMLGGLNDMFLDEDGKLYYCADSGSYGGVAMFDGKQWRSFVLEERPAANSYKAVTQMADGYIYAGGSFGLNIFAAAEPEGEWVHNDLNGYTANTFFHTPEGVWMGHGAGASYYNYATEEWVNYTAVDEPGKGVYGGVEAITVDGKGRVWFGGWNGLTVMDGAKFTHYDLLNDKERADNWSPRSVYALQFDGKNVWVGSYGALFRFDENDKMTRWDEKLPGLLSLFLPSVNAFALDQDGQLLAAIGNYLVKYNADKDQFTQVFDAGGEIGHILTTAQGEIWLGMTYDGAYYYDGEEWTHLTSQEYGLPSNRLGGQSILVDDLGAIWFAGEYGGLARYVP